LRDDTSELRGGFDEQYAGKQRLPGKVPFKEWFVATNLILTFSAAAGVKVQDTIEEAELWPVRQKREGIHLRFGFVGSTSL